MSPLAQLHSITNRLLNAETNAYGELFAGNDELYKVLLQITTIDTEEDKYRQHLALDSGNAIGLTWAAMCIKDIKRTKRFMDGINDAVCDKLQRNAGRAVHILYAGTGPFATLVLPLTARFSSRQLQFTLLEVNESSFNCLQKLIIKLHLEEYIHRIEMADATKWNLPPGEPVDIFISETMQQGLRSEPQVAICMNLVPQLQPETVLIPEQIILKAALINTAKRTRDKLENNQSGNTVHILDTVFTLNKETIMEHAATYKQANETSYRFPEMTIAIPPDLVITHPVLCILTEIMIWNKERLLIDESPLTMPLKLAEISQHPPTEAKFHYQTGKKPGIQFTLQTK